ncbi:MAG TPA: efflux RND transporter periplasmic adaptor subunit [Bacteroidales bacterium]|nr:efflux RND transporter periplasmic adaptor subunit [Bacteroidales bacterium]
MKYYLYCLAILFMGVSVTCCKTNEVDNREEMARRSSVRDAVTVSTVELKRSTFYHELVSNGKVYAKRTATVPFRVEGTIEKVYVKNGDPVQKGQLLAELEDFSYRIQHDKANQQLEKAMIEFKDDLITFHGSEDTIGLSDDMLRMSKIRSGLIDAQTNLKEAEYKLKHTRIYSPIAGTVADLEAKEWNPSNIYAEGLCKIIDNSVIEVEFPVLESEYGFISRSMPVNIIPFISSGDEYTGSITKINPMVDENGMVKVRAELSNGGRLLEGMNVKILIRKPVENRLVIPKEALVIRQGRDVVFVRQDSLAIWKYVTTEFENSDSFSISEGLEEGDLVIHRGNVNLAHETVVIEEDK